MNKYIERFEHGTHRHKLFRNVARYDFVIKCINNKCNQVMRKTQVYYFCPKCDFDLCNECFTSQTISESAINISASDDDINCEVDWVPQRFTKSFGVIDSRDCTRDNDDSEDDSD